jgi:hypothetical protein
MSKYMMFEDPNDFAVNVSRQVVEGGFYAFNITVSGPDVTLHIGYDQYADIGSRIRIVFTASDYVGVEGGRYLSMMLMTHNASVVFESPAEVAASYTRDSPLYRLAESFENAYIGYRFQETPYLFKSFAAQEMHPTLKRLLEEDMGLVLTEERSDECLYELGSSVLRVHKLVDDPRNAVRLTNAPLSARTHEEVEAYMTRLRRDASLFNTVQRTIKTPGFLDRV